METADGNQVTLKVAHADVGKGGQMVLHVGSQWRMELTWLDSPDMHAEEAWGDKEKLE